MILLNEGGLALTLTLLPLVSSEADVISRPASNVFINCEMGWVEVGEGQLGYLLEGW